MAEITINATKRTEFGKGASRRDRRAGNVPAVIYGHGETPQHVALPLRELGAALKSANVLLDVTFDGKTELTLPKSVTRNPLTGVLAHIDLVIVRRGERVKVEVPVHTTGKHDVDGILEHMHNTIEVEAASKIAFAVPNRASDETSHEITKSAGLNSSGAHINSVPGRKSKDAGVVKPASPTVTCTCFPIPCSASPSPSAEPRASASGVT